MDICGIACMVLQVVNTILLSIPQSNTIALLLLFIMVVWAIAGMNLFMGLFFYCNDKLATSLKECSSNTIFKHSSKLGKVYVPRVWKNQPFSFDDFGSALLLLGEVSY